MSITNVLLSINNEIRVQNYNIFFTLANIFLCFVTQVRFLGNFCTYNRGTCREGENERQMRFTTHFQGY